MNRSPLLPGAKMWPGKKLAESARHDIRRLVGPNSVVTLGPGQFFRETATAWQVCDAHGIVRPYPKKYGHQPERL